ncbi:sn-glycerol-3-phosphate ABC transporter ATP-binding protein UgpC [Devosia sp. PTR5]|uniref:Sn-glycerol-3-phosphate ABC transporter ATP-binding protein UgpC n=1 Tax=Devosia oryzisoli TaxID=2774138 RepID=A0A927FSX0_9HYPH|nr:sn-glycerol-3-phosphate ABC transporter ATP-binding protein UgpC [Devosia oryzisoli]MBD8064559.1 sn-glycerol-3-phosphate ABC transporter ATP-binding protein UgpC [Devosia oryzisoli]
MAAVEIRNVAKSFGPTDIIRNVTVEVPDGAFVVLVGPSGCGKSTLLRMIAGLEDIDKGEISIGGRVINDVEPKHRDIAMVFQNYALYPHMTIAENMGFSLRLARQSKKEIEERVQEAARILGLSEYLHRYPKQLSGGQRQRVAMGRAIVRQPQVFLFDEPLSNLDAKLRVQMRGELKDMHARFKTTTIYVTHDQIEAMTMADLIVVMRDGVVEQIGTPLDLYDYPANMFVGSFIGSPAMNFLKGAVRQVNGQQVFETGSGFRLPLHAAAAAPDGLMATLGIRPEHLSLSRAGEGLAGRIVTIEPTGSETFVVLQLGEDRISALLRQRLTASVGDELWLAPQLDTTHLFDSATTKRLTGS